MSEKYISVESQLVYYEGLFCCIPILAHISFQGVSGSRKVCKIFILLLRNLKMEFEQTFIRKYILYIIHDQPGIDVNRQQYLVDGDLPLRIMQCILKNVISTRSLFVEIDD